ncbi:MAG: hypothetical protein M0T79_14935 [Actinomycetota bacterium]|nr:hypothetical protein [Actinomycetota bacterium]
MAQTWVVIGIFGAFAVGVLAMLWSRLDRLDAKIEGLDGKVDGLGARLDARIDELGTSLNARIDAQSASLGARIDAQGREIRDLGQEVHALAERQAEMNGEQRVLREMAHTHSAT